MLFPYFNNIGCILSICPTILVSASDNILYHSLGSHCLVFSMPFYTLLILSLHFYNSLQFSKYCFLTLELQPVSIFMKPHLYLCRQLSVSNNVTSSFILRPFFLSNTFAFCPLICNDVVMTPLLAAKGKRTLTLTKKPEDNATHLLQIFFYIRDLLLDICSVCLFGVI